MATTTNFGWETPDDTDLVKDGAAAIRTLGSAIDTSLVDLKGGTTGQVLSKTSNTDMDFTWVTSDDANAIQNAIVDAKGDLIAATANDTPARLASSGVDGDILTVDTTTATGLKWSAPAASSPLTTKGDLYTYTTTNARLGVGNNGETLVADSSATTGLRWQGNFAAGKNKIINGDFYINQRGFTSNTADGAYNFDRWMQTQNGASQTITPQTFTPGTAPVAGYEGKTFLRSVVANSDTASEFAAFLQKIEDVRTFAGQTITVSFWAKAASGTPKIALEWNQNFGSGGSPSSQVNNYAGQVTISTSWARYSITYTVPSISGKTIGTTENTSSSHCMFWISAGSDYNARTGSIGHQNNTFDIWGVQVEAGSVATPFTTATGTLAGELAAAQRYYFRSNNGGNAYARYGIGRASSATNIEAPIYLPVPMRIAPTSVDFSSLTTTTSNAITAIALNQPTTNVAFVDCTSSSLTTGQAVVLMGNNSTSAYIGFSAEL